MADVVAECLCEFTTLAGDTVVCPQCGLEVASARKQHDYNRRLAALSDRQPRSALKGDDGSVIDDLLAFFEGILRRRRELWAADQHEELERLDQAQLTWAKKVPKRLLLQQLAPGYDDGTGEQSRRQPTPRVGALRRLADDRWMPSNDALLEELRSRCKAKSPPPADVALSGVVGVLGELIERGCVSVRSVNKADVIELRAIVAKVFAKESTAIRRARALTGLSEKTIDAASSRIKKARASFDERIELAKRIGVRPSRPPNASGR